MQQRNINKDFRILFGDIFIVLFLGPALGYLTAQCVARGGEVAFDWNDLPVGRELDWKFLKNVKFPPHALSPPLPPAYIDRCIRTVERAKICQHVDRKKAQWNDEHSLSSNRGLN